jgi:hypothetical protein
MARSPAANVPCPMSPRRRGHLGTFGDIGPGGAAHEPKNHAKPRQTTPFLGFLSQASRYGHFASSCSSCCRSTASPLFPIPGLPCDIVDVRNFQGVGISFRRDSKRSVLRHLTTRKSASSVITKGGFPGFFSAGGRPRGRSVWPSGPGKERFASPFSSVASPLVLSVTFSSVPSL